MSNEYAANGGDRPFYPSAISARSLPGLIGPRVVEFTQLALPLEDDPEADG